MNAAIKKRVIIIIMVLPVVFSVKANVPVMPLPQHVQETEIRLQIGRNIALSGIGLCKESIDALKDHWKSSTSQINTTSPVTLNLNLVLLGKGEAIDQLIRSTYGSHLSSLGKEGYLLILNAKHRIIAANTETGLFYGLQTLEQLIRNNWNTELFIADWPSYKHRVVYDDISRGPISTINYIKKQIERLAELKINYLSFYIEHVVQPISYSDFAPANGKLTIAQIKELSAYAAKYHMQLIGSFQSFGHFEKILSLPQYKDLGETATLISPLDPKAKTFLEKVIGELCDAFNAPFFNVNCDETFGLSEGRSKAYVDSVGEARFYADHLKFLYSIVKRHNKRMMMWGDVALQHEDMLDSLPNDIIYLTWEYGDQKTYDAWIAPFAKRKLEFMVCPGILNSYRLFPDMAMAKANINGFITAGKQAGATGAFTTIWDDGGLNLFSADWYGIYTAAEKSWNVETKSDGSFDQRYEQNAYGFSDRSYTNALFKLMELRSVLLTYNLNDQLWKQKLLPDSGRKLIINNASAHTALAILKEAAASIAMAHPKWNAGDVNTLKFAIAWYRLIIDSRIEMAGLAKKYLQVKNKMQLNACINIAGSLQKRYVSLEAQYRQNWLQENQEYWLNISLGLFDEKINKLDQLKRDLAKAKVNSLPAPAAISLDVVESPGFYFQNWMLVGPFVINDDNTMPDNITPSPGDFTMYKGNRYKWEKYASENGAVIYLNENYPIQKGAVVYAYCRITAEENSSVDAFVASTGGIEIHCNGVKAGIALPGLDTEQKISIPLKKGVNHILLKLPSGAFTFRLDNKNNVTNHKHKYNLNAKDQVHEAE